MSAACFLARRRRRIRRRIRRHRGRDGAAQVSGAPGPALGPTGTRPLASGPPAPPRRCHRFRWGPGPRPSPCTHTRWPGRPVPPRPLPSVRARLADVASPPSAHGGSAARPVPAVKAALPGAHRSHGVPGARRAAAEGVLVCWFCFSFVLEFKKNGEVCDTCDPGQPLWLGPLCRARAVPGHALPALQQRRPSGKGTWGCHSASGCR